MADFLCLSVPCLGTAFDSVELLAKCAERAVQLFRRGMVEMLHYLFNSDGRRFDLVDLAFGIAEFLLQLAEVGLVACRRCLGDGLFKSLRLGFEFSEHVLGLLAVDSERYLCVSVNR